MSVLFYSCSFNLRYSTDISYILRAYSGLKKEQYEKEIKEIKAREDKEIEGNNGYLLLAILYFSADSPEKNYYLALNALKNYLRVNPDKADRGDIKSLRALLEDIVNLQDKNKVWKEKIESLEKLDIKMEELRKENK
jgi:hypothetical protein